MSEIRISALEARVAELTEHLEHAKGKVLALEGTVLVFARHWGLEPQVVIEALHNLMEVYDDPKKCPGLGGLQKEVAMALVETVSSALHSRNR
ncbi:hypothetical protein ACIPR8_19785 [Stenotrophomonas sp. LARHCG68]